MTAAARPNGPDWTVELPPEWKTAEWQIIQPLATVDLAGGKQGLVVSCLLTDGTNIYALTYPGGQRLLRSCEANNWAIEERYTGRPPRPRDRKVLDKLWRATLDAIRRGMREAERELGGRP